MRVPHLHLFAGCVRFIALALCMATVATAQAVTLDITSQFGLMRSGLVLNRTTNTFDATVNLTNRSGAPVLAPISVVVGGLPSGVTLANKTGTMADGRPYVSPMSVGSQLANGATLSIVLKFSNPSRVAITYFLQVLYIVETPANAPSLLGVVATGGTNANLIGRVEGAASQAIKLAAAASATCVSGTLVTGAAVGGTISATTDEEGYFAANVSGISPGTFVTIALTSPRTTPASLCQVSSRDNDSWPKAFRLDGPATVTTRDYIDAPGRARWYKLSVSPGQRLQVLLSDLPADYDLAVFKDIGQTFLKQFDPATANTNELVRLAAETAPSTFSPSTFSPSTFSPSTFSPDAYAPSTFSPSTFSPSVYAPSTFSPSTFSPSTFSPSTFSPSTFSPSTFSPSTFSPSTFSPSIYTEAEIAKAFSTAQTRSIVAFSPVAGNGSESLVVNTWNNTGDFYLRVTGRGGAFNTGKQFTVAVTKGATTCASVTDTALTPRPLRSASGLKTVILADSSKVPFDEPLAIPGGGTLREKLATFAARPDIKGVLVDVAGDTRVAQLKKQAADNPACPFAKNLVAEEIKGVVDTYRANPLEYVVIVGNDDSIPFFRSPDLAELGQESSYVPPVQSNTASEASLRRDYVLSQDAYGSKTKLFLPWSDFPVPGLAVGRLVETPAEIAGIIDAYVLVNGVVVPKTSLVTGYDFLEDAANAVKTELETGTGAASDTLITPNGKAPADPASWNATQLGNKLLGSRHDLVFLAGHFSANSALAADFTTNLLTTDLAASSVDLSNAIVFSAGCHSGYNIVDTDSIPGVTMPLDWAQAFARKRATLIAGTGYQYGDTDFLEYSERLYRNFARSLRAGTGAVSIGQALVQAKTDYLATTAPDIRGLHEKALLQATLFGLPMLGVNMPYGRGSAAGGAGVIAAQPVLTGPAATLNLDLRSYNLSVAPSLTSQTLALKNILGGPDVIASWLNGPDGVVTQPGEPALPLAAVNVTPTDSSIVLRGIGFRGGTFVDSLPIVPFTGAPTTEIRGVHGQFVSPVFYPARMWSPNYFGALAGNGGTQLLVTPAQHRNADLVQGTSTQRRYTNLDLLLYYSGELGAAALSDAPSIVSVEEVRSGGDVLFTAQVVGDPAAAIHQVWVTYASDGGTSWTSLDLVQCVAPLPAACGTTEDSRLWKGRLVGAPSGLRYIVQAVSGIGLVAVDDNRGSYYGISAPTPLATTLELIAPPATAAVGDTVNINVKLSFAGLGIAGKIVSVAIGGASKFGTTDADGSVTVAMPVAAVPGIYPITASFIGDDSLLPASATSSFQLNKAAASLAGLAPAGVTLTGTLGGRTQALQQEAVSFAVAGPAGPTTIWVITDYLGRAPLPPVGLPAGSYTVTSATFGGNANYAPITVNFPTAQQFNVAKIAQNISFGPIPNTPFGSLLTANAAASSGLPVTLAASGPCSVAGNWVQTTGIGSCTITASQPGDDVYAAAAQQQRTFTISPASQAITFAPAPVGVTVGQPLVIVSASSSSPAGPPSTIPIAFTSLSPTICSVGGGINTASITPLGVGTCTIAADQIGDAVYNAAPQSTLSFGVGAAGAPPATFVVTKLADTNDGNCNADCSLREAIAAANAAAGPEFRRLRTRADGYDHADQWPDPDLRSAVHPRPRRRRAHDLRQQRQSHLRCVRHVSGVPSARAAGHTGRTGLPRVDQQPAAGKRTSQRGQQQWWRDLLRAQPPARRCCDREQRRPRRGWRRVLRPVPRSDAQHLLFGIQQQHRDGGRARDGPILDCRRWLVRGREVPECARHSLHGAGLGHDRG